MRRIVCDTAPLLSLQEANLLNLLPLAGRLYIPPAVKNELRTFDPIPDWLGTATLSVSFEEEAQAWVRAGLLDVGEAEAIALARQLEADWLLTDDTAARLLARREGLEVHGSLGLVLWAAANRHFDLEAAQAALDSLSRSSLWISARVMEEARQALPELCSRS